jgi:hypothetical protein
MTCSYVRVCRGLQRGPEPTGAADRSQRTWLWMLLVGEGDHMWFFTYHVTSCGYIVSTSGISCLVTKDLPSLAEAMAEKYGAPV